MTASSAELRELVQGPDFEAMSAKKKGAKAGPIAGKEGDKKLPAAKSPVSGCPKGTAGKGQKAFATVAVVEEKSETEAKNQKPAPEQNFEGPKEGTQSQAGSPALMGECSELGNKEFWLKVMERAKQHGTSSEGHGDTSENSLPLQMVR